jgi:hypothetical protein
MPLQRSILALRSNLGYLWNIARKRSANEKVQRASSATVGLTVGKLLVTAMHSDTLTR